MRGNMKAERARKGLSASDVAAAIGVNVNQIFRWEQNEQSPSATNLLKLAKFYGCTPDYLLDVTSDRAKAGIPSAE